MICPYCYDPLPMIVLDYGKSFPWRASISCVRCHAKFTVTLETTRKPSLSDAEWERIRNRPAGKYPSKYNPSKYNQPRSSW